MRIKNTMSIVTDTKDIDGNPVPKNEDVIILRQLEDYGEPVTSQEEQNNIDEFINDIQKYKGCLAINENFETTYIPPYDRIESVLRHKFKGNEFVIVDLSKLDKTAFIHGMRINDDTEV